MESSTSRRYYYYDYDYDYDNGPSLPQLFQRRRNSISSIRSDVTTRRCFLSTTTNGSPSTIPNPNLSSSTSSGTCWTDRAHHVLVVLSSSHDRGDVSNNDPPSTINMASHIHQLLQEMAIAIEQKDYDAMKQMDSTIAFELLDRLVQQWELLSPQQSQQSQQQSQQQQQTKPLPSYQQQQQQQDDSMTMFVPGTMSQRCDDILKLWRFHVQSMMPLQQQQQQQQQTSSSSKIILRPSQILSKLDTYRAHSTYIIPTVHSYNILLDGIGYYTIASPSTMVTSSSSSSSSSSYFSEGIFELGQQIWDWMWQQTDNLIRPDIVTLQTMVKAYVMAQQQQQRQQQNVGKHRKKKNYNNIIIDDGTDELVDKDWTIPHLCEQLVDTWERHMGGHRSQARKALIYAWMGTHPQRAEQYLFQWVTEYLQRQTTHIDVLSTVSSTSTSTSSQQPHQQAHSHSHSQPSSSSSSSSLEPSHATIPDVIIWNRIIDAYVKRGNPQRGAELLEELWKFQERILSPYHRERCKPTVVTYNIILDGWARVGNGDAADKLLHHMRTLSSSSSSSSVRPNIISYTTTMKANMNRTERVEEIGNEWLQYYTIDSRQTQINNDDDQHHTIQDQQLATNSNGSVDTDETQTIQMEALDTTFFNTWLAAYAKIGDIDRVLTLLERMGSYGIMPDSVSFTNVLHCYLTQGDEDGAREFLQLVTLDDPNTVVTWIVTLLQWYDQVGKEDKSKTLLEEAVTHHLANADTFVWNRLLANMRNYPERLESIFHSMPAHNNETYRIILRSLASNRNKSSDSSNNNNNNKSKSKSNNKNKQTASFGAFAERVLREWRHVQEEQKEDQPTDIVEFFTNTMLIYAKEGSYENTRSLWNELYSEYRSSGNSRDLQPTIKTMTAVVSAYVNAQQPEKAEEFLEEVRQEYESGVFDVQADVVMYNIVLNGWAQLKQGRKAEQLLEKMGDTADVVSYNTAMHAHVSGGQTDHAEKVLNKLLASHLRPDVASFRVLLSGWSRSRSPNAARRAEALLLRMKELHSSGVMEHLPDEACYRMVLKTLSNCKDNDAGKRAEKILHEIMGLQYDQNDGAEIWSTDTSAYCMVMKAYRGKPEDAEALLHRMCGAYFQGNVALKPSRSAFHIVLEALSNSASPQAALRAESLLFRMKDLYQSGRLETAKPTLLAFNLVLHCWSKSRSKDAGERAEFILNEMFALKLQPTMESYKSVLSAFANTGQVDRAEAVLERLLDAYKGAQDAQSRQSLKPDILCFNAILQACRVARDADRAVGLLYSLEECNDMGILEDVKPTLITYNLVLASLASRGMGQQADSVLQRMRSRRIDPDVVSYNTVLNAWATSRQPESVTRADSLVQEEMDVSPDAKTYMTWLKTITSSSLEDKREKTQHILELMKQDGFHLNARELDRLGVAVVEGKRQ